MATTYLVKVTQLNGEYEMGINVIVTAKSEDEARTEALLSRLNCDLGQGAEWGDNGIYDRCGEVHYRVTGLQHLSSEDAATLARLGIR